MLSYSSQCDKKVGSLSTETHSNIQLIPDVPGIQKEELLCADGLGMSVEEEGF